MAHQVAAEVAVVGVGAGHHMVAVVAEAAGELVAEAVVAAEEAGAPVAEAVVAAVVAGITEK
jgi:hypothetical protein